ncbi:DMT family transporter [Faecalimonas sp.]
MEKTMKKTSVVAILALICCALWGSAFPAVKIGYKLFEINTVGSQILFAGYRFFLAGVLTLLLACIYEKRFVYIKKESVPYVFAQGMLQTTIQYLLFYIGMANTSGAKGSVINASNGFVAIIVAAILIPSEKMTWKKILGCIVGFAGVIFINLSPGAWGSGFSIQGEGMVLLCSIAYGTSSVTLKLISHREKPMTLTAYQLLFGGIVLTFIGIFAGGSITNFTVQSTLLLLYLALLSTVAFTLWTVLLKYNPVSKVAIFGFSIPVFGVALSGIFLGEEILSIKNAIALLCVCAGIIIVNREKQSKDQIIAN